MSAADATAQVANRAIDTIAGQEHQAVRIGMEALSTAANVMRATYADKSPNSGQDDTTRQFMQVMIARAMQDPFEQFVKFMALMREINAASGNGGAPNEFTGQLLKAAIERFLNPPATGAPVSATAEMVRQAPGIISGIVEVIREQRLLGENQMRMATMGRAPMLPQPGPQVIPPNNPAPTVGGAPQPGAPSMEFIQKRIVEILRQPNSSAEQAADDALAFLSGVDPAIPAELVKLGDAGLIGFFQSQPILAQVTNNMPRLIEFIRAFLKLYAESVAEANTGQASAAPDKPPLQN